MSSEHTIELALSKAQLKDHIESFMRASGQIHDHEEVKIDFNTKTLQSNDDNLALTIRRRVEGKGYIVEH